MSFKDTVKKIPFTIKAYYFYVKVWNTLFRKQNIAMMHIGRVGSTVLGDMMNQHPLIFWDGEPFEKLMRIGSNKPNDFTERIIEASRNKQKTTIYCFATKFMPEQHLWEECIDMDLSSYITLLKEKKFNEFLFIKRENYLRQVVSVLVGRMKKEWHSQNRTDKVTKVRIDIDNYVAGFNLKLSLIDYFKRIDAQYQLLESLLKTDKILTISYENDIEKDPFVAYNKVCVFLKVANENPKISYRKTNPFLLEDMIENYDEVKQVLKETKYEWMLEN